MVYFSTAPVAPESLEPTQYEALKKFKEWCYGQGLVEAYDNISDFSEKFRRHIQIKVRENPELAKSVNEQPVNPARVPKSGQVWDVGSQLSSEAKRLLLEAAKDGSGTIIHMRYIGGQAIQTNGINFIDSNERRSIARWEAALEQLEGGRLITALGPKREIFEMTAMGYEVADEITKYTS